MVDMLSPWAPAAASGSGVPLNHRLITLALGSLLVFSLGACGGGSDETASTSSGASGNSATVEAEPTVSAPDIELPARLCDLAPLAELKPILPMELVDATSEGTGEWACYYEQADHVQILSLRLEYGEIPEPLDSQGKELEHTPLPEFGDGAYSMLGNSGLDFSGIRVPVGNVDGSPHHLELSVNYYVEEKGSLDFGKEIVPIVLRHLGISG